MANVGEESVKDKLRSRRLWVGFAAEFLATALFVFLVVGATLSWNTSPSVIHIAVTVGLSIAVLAAAIGHLTDQSVKRHSVRRSVCTNDMANVGEESIKDKLRSRRLWVGFAAEFLATALFVFLVVGATLSWNTSPSVIHIAVTVGLSIAVLAAAIGHLTGILGASVLYALTPSEIRQSFGVTVPAPNLSVGQAVGVEVLLTFLLVFTIHSVTDSKRPDCSYIAPVIIGVCVFICHMVGVYWVGPSIGAVVAALLYDYVFAATKNRVIPSERAQPEDNL
ncbi:hypothetical protein QZH41_006771 [Actinostola sp. cb2023]|nr:hypothetical protein QZH41_006771 [Actinostola sp. cb2023]